jgi:hypothetical protein
MSDMTPLERMARAICEARGIYPTEWHEFLPEARAALMAIREPDMDTSIVGGIVVAEEMKGGEDYFAAKRCWTAMIDHVLKEGEG